MSRQVALSGTDQLDEAVQIALAEGARDIVLPQLLALLRDGDRDRLLQLSVSSLPMTAAAVADALPDRPDDLDAVAVSLGLDPSTCRW